MAGPVRMLTHGGSETASGPPVFAGDRGIWWCKCSLYGCWLVVYGTDLMKVLRVSAYLLSKGFRLKL